MAADFFLKLGDIKGESSDPQHKEEIELLSWSWGASNPPNITSANTGAGTGRVSVSEISCVAQMSKASPFLFNYCSTGKHMPTAKITCRKAGEEQRDFLVIELDEVYIASYHTGGSSGGDVPTDNFSLAYGSVKMDYLEQTKEGTTTSAGKKGWDVRSNKPTP